MCKAKGQGPADLIVFAIDVFWLVAWVLVCVSYLLLCRIDLCLARCEPADAMRNSRVMTVLSFRVEVEVDESYRSACARHQAFSALAGYDSIVAGLTLV